MGKWDYIPELEPRVNSQKNYLLRMKKIFTGHTIQSDYHPLLALESFCWSRIQRWLVASSFPSRQAHPPTFPRSWLPRSQVHTRGILSDRQMSSNPPSVFVSRMTTPALQPLSIVQSKIFHQTSTAHKLVRSATQGDLWDSNACCPKPNKNTSPPFLATQTRYPKKQIPPNLHLESIKGFAHVWMVQILQPFNLGVKPNRRVQLSKPAGIGLVGALDFIHIGLTVSSWMIDKDLNHPKFFNPYDPSF